MKEAHPTRVRFLLLLYTKVNKAIRLSREPGTSKLALVSLARKMEAAGERLIDCQFHTDHLESMGVGRFHTMSTCGSYEEWTDGPERYPWPSSRPCYLPGSAVRVLSGQPPL